MPALAVQSTVRLPCLPGVSLLLGRAKTPASMSALSVSTATASMSTPSERVWESSIRSAVAPASCQTLVQFPTNRLGCGLAAAARVKLLFQMCTQHARCRLAALFFGMRLSWPAQEQARKWAEAPPSVPLEGINPAACLNVTSCARQGRLQGSGAVVLGEGGGKAAARVLCDD